LIVTIWNSVYSYRYDAVFRIFGGYRVLAPRRIVSLVSE